MTDLQAERDDLARLCGYTWTSWGFNPDAGGRLWSHPSWSENRPMGSGWHPFPSGDLTALVAAWPEGVSFTMHWKAGRCWLVTKHEESEGNTEYEARLRLTLAVLSADAVKGVG